MKKSKPTKRCKDYIKDIGCVGGQGYPIDENCKGYAKRSCNEPTKPLAKENYGEVIFKYPNYGYPSDQVIAKKYLEVGKSYAVKSKHVGDWRTDIILMEFPNIGFNSVLFVDKNPTPAKECNGCTDGGYDSKPCKTCDHTPRTMDSLEDVITKVVPSQCKECEDKDGGLCGLWQLRGRCDSFPSPKDISDALKLWIRSKIEGMKPIVIDGIAVKIELLDKADVLKALEVVK